MDNLKDNNRILFIPGWLDSGELHGYKNSLNIWDRKVDVTEKFNVDFVIAHSIGSSVALYNWNIHKNFRVILINPVFLRKNIFKRWLNFIFHEGTSCPPKRIKLFFSAISALAKAKSFFRVPIVDILYSIPKDKITIIYGEKDKYLCDIKVVDQLRAKGLRVIKVKDAGHNYNMNIEQAIIDVISGLRR